MALSTAISLAKSNNSVGAGGWEGEERRTFVLLLSVLALGHASGFERLELLIDSPEVGLDLQMIQTQPSYHAYVVSGPARLNDEGEGMGRHLWIHETPRRITLNSLPDATHPSVGGRDPAWLVSLPSSVLLLLQASRSLSVAGVATVDGLEDGRCCGCLSDRGCRCGVRLGLTLSSLSNELFGHGV